MEGEKNLKFLPDEQREGATNSEAFALRAKVEMLRVRLRPNRDEQTAGSLERRHREAGSQSVRN